MRTVLEAAGTRPVDTTDGVRIVDADRGWVLVLPDPADAVTHLWAEGGDADSAQLLLDEWAAIVEQAWRVTNWPLTLVPALSGQIGDARSGNLC